MQKPQGSRFLALNGLLAAVLIAGCGHVTPLSAAKTAARMPLRAAAADASYTLFSQPDGSGRTAILGAIDAATSKLDLTIYELRSHEVVTHLAAAANRGVAVRVLYEPDAHYLQGHNHRVVVQPTPPGSGIAAMSMESSKDDDALDPAAAVIGDYTSCQAAVRDLQAQAPTAPTAVQAIPADDMHFALTHEKSMVIDDRFAVIMTNNLTTPGLGSNREYGVIDRVPAEVAEVEAMFQADITHVNYHPTQPNLVISPDDGTGQGNSRTKLEALIASATTSLLVEDEVFTDPAFAKLLNEKAAAGVKVRLLVDPSTRSKALPWFGLDGVTPGGWAPPNLLKKGKAGLHAKLIVADEARAYIGSVNMTFQSMGYNRELGILLNDAPLVSSLVAAVKSDLEAYDLVQAAK